MAENTMRITYIKSAQGYAPDQAQTIRSLGFTKLYQTIEKADTPDVRGMVNKVGHLVEIETDQSEDDSDN